MDDFPSTSENQELKEVIVRRIQAEGPIPFREFMAMALYHPQHGYYFSPREKMGRGGDYLTSPEAHPLFGALVGRQLRQMWEVLDRPPAFAVVEIGAGTAALCRDILRWARRNAPDFFAALSYRIVEVSDELREGQRRSLRSVDASLSKVSWGKALPRPGVRGCILSNELVDSFPVHRLAVYDGKLCEVYVGWDGQRFVEELRAPSTPEIEAYFQRLGLLPGEACYAEVNLEALAWMKQVARALSCGFVLTFDYGYEAPELYAPWRRGGTLLCFYRHNPSNDPYARLGHQDMTSHVDFTSLAQVGRENGLELMGITSQSRFLAALGLGEALRGPGEADLSPSASSGQALEEYYARRRAALELLDPAGLGRTKVMVQKKSVGDCQLMGLEGGRE